MKPKSVRRAFLASTITLAMASSAHAANLYWDGNDGTAGFGTASGTWADPTAGTSTSGWSTSINGTTAINGNSITTVSTDLLNFGTTRAGLAAGSIAVSGSVAANRLTFGSTSGTITLSGGTINLGGTTPTVEASNTTNTISSILAGSAGLTKTGTGALILNGSALNTLTGGLNLNGGLLSLDLSNLTTGLIDSGNAISLGGGTLSILAKLNTNSSQTLGSVTVNSGGGKILGNKNGAGTFNITLGSITATASGGSLLLGASGNVPANTPTITTTSGTLTNGIYGGRMVYYDGTANTGYNWATTLSAGPTYDVSGLLSYAPLATTSGTDTDNSRITAGAAFTADSIRTTNSLKFENPASAQTLDLTSTGTLTLASGGLLFTGASVAQGPRINSGSLTAGNGSGSYDLVVHAYNATAQNIVTGITGTNLALVTSINSAITDNGANPVTLVKAGPGSLLLGGSNTFTGGIVVNEGHLAFNTATAINNNPITFNANATVHTFSGSTTSGQITINNNSQLLLLNNNSSFTVTGNVTGSGGISVAQGGQGSITANLNSPASNAGGNSFTGPIRFEHTNNTQSATVNVGSLSDSVGAGNIIFGAGVGSSISHNFAYNTTASAALTLNNRQFELAGTQVVNSISNSSAHALTINPNLLVTGTTAKNLILGGSGAGLSTFAGGITNSPNPTAAGTTLLGVRTTAASGTLTLASVEGITAGSTITGTGIVAATTITAINPITRVVTLSQNTSGGIALGTVFTIPNVVNSISLTKSGTSTWVLDGQNTYTGATNVTAGALIINGSTSSTSIVSVSAGATIGGTGNVRGNTTVSGFLSPGVSPGTLSFENALTLNTGSTYVFEGGDLTAVGTVLTLTNNWTLQLGSGFVDGGSVTIFTYGSLAGSPALNPTFNTANLGFTPSGSLSLTNTGNSIVLNGVSAIPEPSTALLGALGLLALLRRKR